MTFDKSQWISTSDRPDKSAAPLFRREFLLHAPIESATLNICGLGYYEAWINQQRVGDHVLDPAQTDYEKRVFYVSYDVTGLVQEGGNCIGVLLGNGWYNQHRVWGNGKGLPYGPPKLLLELNVTLGDGRAVTVNSDESWRCTRRGPVTANNIYAGESYDARLEMSGWDGPGFDDSGWEPAVTTRPPGGALEPQALPPIRKIEELTPVRIDRLDSGVYVVDIGQNIAGWARIQVTAAAGTEIRMRFAEALAEDGSIDTASTGVFATGVEQVDSYICRGPTQIVSRSPIQPSNFGMVETWEPRFTYHGFRYIEVSGWPGELTPRDITGVVVHTDLPVAGAFECSDSRLNQLHSMALWTHRDNIHGIPEDCPARERCGWLGDANLVAEYSLWNFQSKAFWEKFLDDIETTRLSNQGLPANVAPGKRCTQGVANPDWAAAFIMLPWYLYLHSGDITLIQKHWDGMTRLMEYFREKAECPKPIFNKATDQPSNPSIIQSSAREKDDWILSGGYGDFFDPGGDAIVSHTPPPITSTFWFFRCADVMSAMADALGDTSAAVTYRDWKDRIARAVTECFYNKDLGTFGSQAADVLALAFEILPKEDPRLLDALVRDIRNRDTHVNVGVMGLRYILEVLTQRGRGELALALTHQNTYPSLGHLIERGATTLWECWGEKDHDQTHGARSLNHPFMGGYDNWFFNTLAGIEPDPDHPGFRHFFLRPRPISGLKWVKAYHDSPPGRIVSHWEIKNDRFEWTVTVPANTRATAMLPFSGRSRLLQPGRYDLLDYEKN